jgi:hypothetical protein
VRHALLEGLRPGRPLDLAGMRDEREEVPLVVERKKATQPVAEAELGHALLQERAWLEMHDAIDRPVRH